MSELECRFVQVPPPAKAPVQPLGEVYGLPRGVRLELSHGQYRCAECGKMQRSGSPLAWVSDGTSSWDPPWSVTENERRNAYNGSGSGWCLHCARCIGRPWLHFWPMPAILAGIVGIFIFISFV